MKVLFRADASPRRGTGHVMRCLALAEAVRRRGGEARFACAELPESLARRLASAGFEVERLAVTVGGADDLTGTRAAAEEWVVADGYRFDADFHAGLQRSGLRLVVLDDGGRLPRYDADLVLNPNLFADPRWYDRRGVDTRLLLGPRYVPLRGEFVAWRSRERHHAPIARRLVVTLGGADPINASERLLEALTRAETDFEVTLVIGGGNPRAAELQRAARGIGARVEVDSASMARLFAEADMAVASGGTTALELAFMGLPALLLVIAENQERVVAAMTASGSARRLRLDEASRMGAQIRALASDPATRRAMSARGKQLIDGRGADRVARALAAASEIRLRPAASEHRRLVWEWVNDPATRAASFSRELIPWDDHAAWYDDRLRREPPELFLAETPDGQPVGLVRLEVHGRRGRMPINVAPRFRGRGYGSLIVDLGSSRLLDRADVEAIDVYVRPENEASLRMFRSADFEEVGMTTQDGQQVMRLERRRDRLPVSGA